MPDRNYAPKMNAESELMIALQEWRNAGAPVVDVVQTIDTLIDEKIKLALSESEKNSG